MSLMGSQSKNIENVQPISVRQALKLLKKKKSTIDVEQKVKCSASLKQEQVYSIWRFAGSIPLKSNIESNHVPHIKEEDSMVAG